MPAPLPISGYVLAGGLSSRMGTEKSLLSLDGNPLIAHAVGKLRRVCAEVHILSSNPALAAYAPLVPDLHPGCGPVGGIEAALAHSPHDYLLILPVDVPFLPSPLLEHLAAAAQSATTGASLYEVDGRPQPAVCLLHKQLAPSIAAAIRLAELKLFPVLRSAAEVCALQQNQTLEQSLRILRLDPAPTLLASLTPAQLAARPLWLANLNTPEDFAQAQHHTEALEL